MRPLARGQGLCDIDSLLSRKFQKNIFKNGKFWDTDYKPDCKTRILVLFRHDFPFIYIFWTIDIEIAESLSYAA